MYLVQYIKNMFSCVKTNDRKILFAKPQVCLNQSGNSRTVFSTDGLYHESRLKENSS